MGGRRRRYLPGILAEVFIVGMEIRAAITPRDQHQLVTVRDKIICSSQPIQAMSHSKERREGPPFEPSFSCPLSSDI